MSLISKKEFIDQLNRKAFDKRVPLSGSIELTQKCNLRCVHCYLGDKNKLPDNELTVDQWKFIIDELIEAGCLFLLITGGEPLLRKDFPEIYTYAKQNGLLVTVFTNGTLITDKIIELFIKLPPHVVDITLYGATPETCEKITCVKDSYTQAIQGIETLLHYQLNVELKTILMTINSHEFDDIKSIAEKYGVKFRFDAAVFPRFNGDQSPINLRVSPKEIIEKELSRFSEEKMREEWKHYQERMQNLPVNDSLYICGAGVTSFHIDCYGNMMPCLMTQKLTYNLTSGSFKYGWNQIMPKLRETKSCFPCNSCEQQIVCGYCPSFFELETGRPDIQSEFICVVGKQSYEAINKLMS